MRTLTKLEFSWQVDSLILTLGTELSTGGIHFTWLAFDVFKAEESERVKFMRGARFEPLTEEKTA